MDRAGVYLYRQCTACNMAVDNTTWRRGQTRKTWIQAGKP